MDNNYKFDIDNVFNIFSSNSISELKQKYNLDNYYELKQIHSNIAHIVDNKFRNNIEGDAMITNISNISLVIKTADCLPIILYDSKNKVLAIIHSGWLGTINNIVGNTISKMIDNFHCNTNNISAYIYPSIRQCHFEVDKDVYLKFKNKIKNIDKYTTKKKLKYHIDLQQIVKEQILSNNISNIYDSDICTYCNHTKYHSYRYNHTDKRNYLIAMIKE